MAMNCKNLTKDYTKNTTKTKKWKRTLAVQKETKGKDGKSFEDLSHQE